MASDKAGIKNDTFVIFSSDKSLPDTARFFLDNNIDFKPLIGRYEGENNHAYLVNQKDFSLVAHLVAKQKTVLYLSSITDNGMREAVLISKKDFTLLGRFKPVAQAEAEGKDSFTYDPTAKQFYITVIA